MRLLILSIVLVLSIALTAAHECEESEGWKKYKLEHSLTFNSKEEECEQCRNYEQASKDLANLKKERKDDDDVFGETAFMHINFTSSGLKIDIDELKQRRILNRFRPTLRNIPRRFSWVDKGFRSAVKNQGFCGSCYTFAAAGAIEGQYFKCHNRAVSFSEQYFVDCSPRTGGCCGGDPSLVADFASTSGIPFEHEYPYVLAKCTEKDYESRPRPSRCNQPNECPLRKRHANFQIDTVEHIVPNNVQQLEAAIYEVGPVMVVVNSDRAFQQFKGKLFRGERTSPNPNHAVLAVGYDEEAFIIKNSYGPSFADNGYIRIAKNSPHKAGTAGILSYSQVVRKNGCRPTSQI